MPRRSIYILLIILFSKYCNRTIFGESHTFDNNLRPISENILYDLRSAFQMITNNTNVIHKMYNITTKPINSELVFKIPNESSGHSMLMVKRSDLLTPRFPNLTASYMQLMRSRWHENHSTSTAVIQHKQENFETDDWKLLGLDGWTGTLSKPKIRNETAEAIATYPLHNIYWDLQLGEVEPFIADINTQINEEQQIELTSNIYIARVNDPFGVSINWQHRNSTDTFSTQLVPLNTTEERPKRAAIELYSMIKCSTGCNPLAYKGYGCYCGFLGHGQPVDGIDRCCKLHDKCYGNSNCISYLEYFVPYVWKCYRGKPLCAIDHGEWGGPQSCAARLCLCDLKLSRCLRNFFCPQHRAVCRSSSARQLQKLLFFG